MNKTSLTKATYFPVTPQIVLLFILALCPALLETELLAETPQAMALVSLEQVDHSAWTTLLNKYVDENGMVDYKTWKKTLSDIEALNHYLKELGHASPNARTSREGQLAFWINAYNAQTVHGILEVYPTSSIRNHTAKFFGYNIWHDLPLAVNGINYSLDEIEHKILRTLDEPRIHFAIVCASIGCPRLLSEAYTPVKLESQLAKNTKDFFSRKKHFQVDIGKRQISVSPILNWFGKDFGPTPQKAVASMHDYISNKQARELIASKNFSVSFLDYSWSLNSQ